MAAAVVSILVLDAGLNATCGLCANSTSPLDTWVTTTPTRVLDSGRSCNTSAMRSRKRATRSACASAGSLPARDSLHVDAGASTQSNARARPGRSTFRFYISFGGALGFAEMLVELETGEHVTLVR